MPILTCFTSSALTLISFDKNVKRGYDFPMNKILEELDRIRKETPLPASGSAELAKKLGWDPTVLSHVIADRRPLTVERLKDIAEALPELAELCSEYVVGKRSLPLMSALRTVAQVDKKQLLSLIKEKGFQIQVDVRDSARNVLGKILNYLRNGRG